MTVNNSSSDDKKGCVGRDCLLPDPELMQRFKQARYKGKVEGGTFAIESVSPSCGDKVCFSGRVDQGKVVEVKFQGQGSMLSQVFADALCEFATGRELSQLQALDEKDIHDLIGLEVGPTRFQTLVFVLGVFKKGLEQSC